MFRMNGVIEHVKFRDFPVGANSILSGLGRFMEAP